jgi:L-fucose mutarotase
VSLRAIPNRARARLGSGDTLDPAVEQEYRAVTEQHTPRPVSIARLARGRFYDLAAKAFVIVMTSETRKYGNLVLKKGVTPP